MIDISAISLCIALINIFLCLALFGTWRFQKVYPGFGFWVLANLALALAYILMGWLRYVIPSVIIILTNNLLFLLAAWLRLEGLHRFLEVKRRWYPHFIVMAIVLVSQWYFIDDMAMRTAMISGVLGLYLYGMGWVLVSQARREIRAFYWLMASVFFIYGLLLTSRAVIALIAPSQVLLPAATMTNVSFFLSVMLLDIGVIFAFLMMNDKRLTLELEATEERLARVQGSISDGFLVLNNDLRITYFNDAASGMLGHRQEEALGQKIWDAFPEIRGSFFEEKCTAALREKKFVSFDSDFDQEPSQGWYAIRIYPFSDGISISLQDVTELKRIEGEREALIVQLQKALAEVKTLKGIFPICASCKKIRDDEGYWNQIEAYISKRLDAEFSHGICPECAKKLYPDFEIYNDDGKSIK